MFVMYGLLRDDPNNAGYPAKETSVEGAIRKWHRNSSRQFLAMNMNTVLTYNVSFTQWTGPLRQ